MTTLSFDIYAHNKYSKEFERLSRQLRDVTKDAGSFGDRTASSMAKAANKISNLVTAGTAIQGVGSIVAGLSGTLGLLPGAAAAGASAFAALKVGTQGFADGLKEFADTSKIQKATGGVADATVQAARRITAAEASLVKAQQTSRDAQDGLRRAREHAADQLKELSLALRGASLSEEDAAIGLEQAQQRLIEAQQSGASGLDLREAELGVKQAALAVDEAKDRYADLSKEAAHANAVGVEGSDEVVAAQRQVADAAQAVKDAQEEVAQAHADAAKSAAQAASALDVTTAKFDSLAKSAQDTVVAIVGLKGAWTGVRQSVQGALFEGIAGQVKSLAEVYLPVLKDGLTGIAGQFNTGAHSVADFLKQTDQVKSIQTIFGSGQAVAGQFSQALKPLTSIILDITTVSSEMFAGLTGGFGNAAQRAADFVHNARETGQLRDWIQTGLDTLKKLGQVFGNIAGIASAVFSGLNLGGKNFLDTMLSITGQIKDFLKSFEGQSALKALGQALAAVSSVVTGVMLEAFKQLAPIIVELAPGIAELAQQIGKVLVDALKIVGPILQGLAGFLSDNIGWLGPLAIGLYGAVKAFQAVGVALKVLSILASTNPWVFIIAATIALVSIIVANWDTVKKALAAVWDAIKTAAAAVWEVIKNVIVDPIVTAAKWVGDIAVAIGHAFSDAWDWIVRVTGVAWDHIKSAIIDPISDVVSWIGDRIGDIVGFFADMPGRIGRVLGGIGDAITGAFKAGLNILIDLLNGLIIGVNFIITGINDISPFDDIPPIPPVKKLHTGGVVPGVAGSEKLAVLKAGERVFPPDYDWGKAPSVAGISGSPTAQQQPVQVTLTIQGNGTLHDQVMNGVRTGQIHLQVDGKRVKVAS